MTQQSGVTAAQIDEKLPKQLKGQGKTFVAAGKAHGIDPAFLASIAIAENVSGKYNNPGALMGKNGIRSFGSMSEGINAMASNLATGYIAKGLVTPEQIQSKYAPNGASNDPTGLNSNWTNNVVAAMKDFGVVAGTGQTGLGAFSGWQDKITSRFGERWGRMHNGLDLGLKQGTALGALAGGTVSFLKQDPGNSTPGGNEIGIKMANGQTYSYTHLSKFNKAITERWDKGDRDITLRPGELVGYSGGAPNTPGAGTSTTGAHLHLGYQDSQGNRLNPEILLNSLLGGAGGTTTDFTGKQSQSLNINVNLTGDGAGQLSGLQMSAFKSIVKEIMEDALGQQAALSPTIR